MYRRLYYWMENVREKIIEWIAKIFLCNGLYVIHPVGATK